MDGLSAKIQEKAFIFTKKIENYKKFSEKTCKKIFKKGESLAENVYIIAEEPVERPAVGRWWESTGFARNGPRRRGCPPSGYVRRQFLGRAIRDRADEAKEVRDASSRAL